MSTSIVRGVGIAGLLLALVAAPAAGQGGTPPAAPSTPPGWVATPSVAVAELWDDNVGLSGNDSTRLRDFVTAVSPGMTLGYRGRHTTLSLDYLGTYDFHHDFSQFDTGDHRGRLEMNRRMGRYVTFFARDAVTISPTTEGIDMAAVVLRRRTTRFNDFRGGFDIAPGPRTTITAAYGSQWIAFARDDLVSPLFRGGNAHLADLAVRQRVSPHVTLGVQYDYQYAIVANGGDSFDAQHAAGLIEVQLAPSWQFSGSGGYAWLGPGRDEVRRHAPAFRAALAYNQPRAAWELAYGRSYLPSFGFGGTIQNEELTGSLRVPLGRRLQITGSVSVRDNDPLTPGDVSLRSIVAQGSIVGVLAQWLRLELFALHAFQDSQLAGGQIARTQAGIRLTTLHAMRLR